MFNYVPEKRRSDVPTPLHLCKWLTDLILEHRKPLKVLDPSAGDGRLTRYFEDIERVEFELKKGSDFLKQKEPLDVDLVICNPPFNGHPDRLLYSEVFLDHILELVPENTPIFIFCTHTFRLNNRRRSKRIRKLPNYNIDSIISLPLDLFENVFMFCEIIVLNFPELKSHYSYYPDEELLEQLSMSEQTTEFDNMSSDEIDALIKKAQKAKAAKTKQELKDLKASIKALIDNSPFTLKDIFPELFKESVEATNQEVKAKPAKKTKTASKAQKKAPEKKVSKPKKKSITPKFSNPNNRGDEWTGRGARLPLWVSDILEQRKITKEQFKADPQYLNPKHEDYKKFQAELSGEMIDATEVAELAKSVD
jgi:DNA-binding protein H-NS